jgi:hypothetical protein
VGYLALTRTLHEQPACVGRPEEPLDDAGLPSVSEGAPIV